MPVDPSNSLFDPGDRKMLAHLADSILPVEDPDTDQPVYDCPTYVERLLRAFEQDAQQPPLIYAGGPFSNRDAPSDDPKRTDSFKSFLPLTRYQTLAWRLRLEGPQAVRDTDPFANVSDDVRRDFVGMRQLILEGLARAERFADDLSSKRVATPDELFFAAGPDFQKVFGQLVAEAAFGAPEYGGNLNGRAWAEIFYPGDSLPAGYSGNTVSQPDPDADKYPIDALGDLLFKLLTLFTHGREF